MKPDNNYCRLVLPDERSCCFLRTRRKVQDFLSMFSKKSLTDFRNVKTLRNYDGSPLPTNPYGESCSPRERGLAFVCSNLRCVHT